MFLPYFTDYTLLNVGLCGLCGLCVVLWNLIPIYNSLIWGTKGPKRSKKDQKDVPGEPLSHPSQGSNDASTASYSDGASYLLDLLELLNLLNLLHLLDTQCYTSQTNVSNTELYEATCRHGRGWNVHRSRYIDYGGLVSSHSLPLPS